MPGKRTNTTRTRRAARRIARASDLTLMQAADLYRRHGAGVDLDDPDQLAALIARHRTPAPGPRPTGAHLLDPDADGAFFLTNGCLENTAAYQGRTPAQLLQAGLPVALGTWDAPRDATPADYRAVTCPHCTATLLEPARDGLAPLHDPAPGCPAPTHGPDDWYPLTVAEQPWITDHVMAGPFSLAYAAAAPARDHRLVKALVPTAELSYADPDLPTHHHLPDRAAMLEAAGLAADALTPLAQRLGGFVRLSPDAAPGGAGHLLEAWLPLPAVMTAWPDPADYRAALDAALA